MKTPAIDTLGLARRLKNGGIESSDAETLASVLGDELTERMVTKHELAESEARVRADIGALAGRFETVDTKIETLTAVCTQTTAELEAMRDEMGAMATRDETAAEFKAVRNEMGAMATRDEMTAEFKAVRNEMAAGFATVDAKFEMVDTKIEALDNKISMQGRFVFLVLAIVAGLGIINAAGPYLLFNELRQTLRAPQVSSAHPAVRLSPAVGVPPQSETGQSQDGSTVEPTLHPLGDSP